jgi:histidinol dehydrogenase
VLPDCSPQTKMGPGLMVHFKCRSPIILCEYFQELEDPELSAESKEAFDIAYDNIKAFHEAQRSAPLEVETMPGVRCRRVTRPIGQPDHHVRFKILSVPKWLREYEARLPLKCSRQVCTDLASFAGAVGIYVPGGTAVLPSSTLMMAVPAQIAGCRTVVMATPPRKDGQVEVITT